MVVGLDNRASLFQYLGNISHFICRIMNHLSICLAFVIFFKGLASPFNAKET